jgi:hypothetical protein
MKKFLSFITVAALLAAGFTSCNKDDDDDDPIVVEASKIKTLGVNYGDGTEGYEFVYDNNDRVMKIYNSWEGEVVDTIKYDYSVSGKLTITKEGNATVYEVNAQGLVTKEIWDETSYASYTYSADGYLTGIKEFWDGTDHKKFDVEVTSNNIMKHTRYGDDGVANRIKTFTYTTGDNKSELHQANAVDSNWKTIGNLFGKPSTKLVDFLKYWEPGDEANTGTTTITYTFDTKNRVATMTRAGDGWQEIFTYSYYED